MLIALVILAAAVSAALAGLAFAYFDTEDTQLNLIAEAIGIIFGGIVIAVALRLLEDRARRQEWQKVSGEVLSNLSWHIEELQFSLRKELHTPFAWHVGRTLPEELRAFAETNLRRRRRGNRPSAPLSEARFKRLSDLLQPTIEYVSSTVLPRMLTLERRTLAGALLRLENASYSIRVKAAEASPESERENETFNRLVENVLRAAADAVEEAERARGLSPEAAAQERADRLTPLELRPVWDSRTRSVLQLEEIKQRWIAEGEPYFPDD